MKLILNNKNDEVIVITNFNRNLDINNPVILFNIYFSTDTLENISTMSYLTQYAEAKITSYKILDNDDKLLLDVNNIDAKLTNFNETFTDGYYSANASVQIMKEEITTTEEEEEEG